MSEPTTPICPRCNGRRESYEATLCPRCQEHAPTTDAERLREAATAILARWDATLKSHPENAEKYPLPASEFEALRQALSAPAQGNGWRTMEDAPRDGTDILVTDGTDHSVARWSKHRNAWVGQCDGKEAIESQDYIRIYYFLLQPTHWQPLPAPPAAMQPAAAKEGE